MSEFVFNVPKDLDPCLKQLSKKEVEEVFSNALRQRLSEKLMFRIADELLKESEITDELALEWGRELKKEASRKRRRQ